MASRRVLVLASSLSALLLLLFGVFQQLGAAFLSLPAQWLLIAVLPVVVALFIGGYISRFKGFGVELEAALTAPVTFEAVTW